jgi:mannose-1-phosphate guanylyltransferase
VQKADRDARKGASWAVVLAGGDGLRLSSLTTDLAGRAVPKQFCSLRGERALIDDALDRARGVADPGRVLVIVAEKHRAHWSRLLGELPAVNVLVQPLNRGTAAGILYPLLTILERDPEAHVAWIPSDHYVRSEATLLTALHLALRQSRQDPHVTLLGVRPDSPEQEYGWIVPRSGRAMFHSIARFVEKPDGPTAQGLLTAGALWNTFLLIGPARAFLGLFELRLPKLLAGFRSVFGLPQDSRASALSGLYSSLPDADFSRDVLQHAAARLRVLTVPACGWTDLGNPKRVAECLRELPSTQPPRTSVSFLRLDHALAALETGFPGRMALQP